MRLTKQQAIDKHRDLWNWIADRTEQLQICMRKSDYYDSKYHKFKGPIPINHCYCCQYAQ